MRACAVGLALALAACGSGSRSGVTDAGDTGVVADGAITAPLPVECQPVPNGYVAAGGSRSASGLSASFFTSFGSITCTHMTIGSCVLLTTNEDPTNQPQPDADAGAITAAGGATTLTATLTTIMTAGGAQRVYVAGTSAQPLWQDGRVGASIVEPLITIAAAGSSQIPAFSTTLIGPPTVTVTSPRVDTSTGEPTPVSRANGLAIAWSGFGVGNVDAALSATSKFSIHCRWPVAAHDATIPAELLEQLPATQAQISVRTDTSTTVVAGAWSVYVEVGTGGVMPNGNASYVDLTLQ